ncbi:MAG: hypothetical protein ABH884_00450 [Candidatus Komeilibacteria bacterium]
MIRGSKKIILSMIIICLAGSIIFGSLIIPKPVEAFSSAATIAQTVADWGRWFKDIAKDIKDGILAHLKSKMVTDAVEIFAQRLAIKTAESIVAGDRGQGSLVEGRVFQDILKDAAGAAAGDYIGSLSEKWEGLGIDLCEPSLDIKVSITMSLLKGVQPPKPKCDLADIVKNWDRFIADYDLDNLEGKNLSQAMSGVLSGLNVSFQPGRSDFSAAVKLNNQLIAKMDEEEAIALAERTQGWFKDKLNPTGTQVQTGAAVVQDSQESITDATLDAQQAKTTAALADPNGTVLSRALSSFTNTLTAKLINKWLKEGFSNLTTSKNRQIAIDSLTGSAGSYNDSSIFRQGSITSQARSDYYSDLAVVTFGEPEEYDPLADFTVCPSNKDMIGLNNCVMSSKFYAAFNRGEPITLKEAINLKLIDPNLPLINKDSSDHSDLQYCYKEALCYSNLQKMRLARLIPLGWEIAAEKSSVDDPVTLQEVINAFNDSDSQYYKLIDSDWILKAPLAQCRAQGYGPRLESKYGAGRDEICVDTQTCLQETDDGSCLPGAWGYCTREENVWRFGGDQCNEAFASCRGFTNQNGTSYFIKDTVDFCGADEVGCQSYSTQKDADDNWTDALIYLNDQAGTCEGQNAGCSELIKTEPGINFLPNGGFELGDQGWQLSNGAPVESAISDEKTYAGNYAAKIVSDGTERSWISEAIEIPRNNLSNTMTISAQYAYSEGSDIDLVVLAYDSDPGDEIYPGGWSSLGLTRGVDNDNNWHSISLVVEPDSTIRFVRVRVDANGGNTTAYFDNLQIELGANATTYKPYGQYNLTYLKKAPDYLNCDDPDQASNDCYQYAPVCEASEVGCELYTPVSGDPAVPGKVSADDYCNEECNNYQSYAQMVTPIEAMFDQVVPASRDFIYDTAQECSLAAVGCEEFTDISDSENRMYYNGLRMCVTTDNPNIGVYYTWEGSDTTGYQLKVWQLLQSNADNGPCTNIQYDDVLGQNVCTDDVIGIDNCADDPDAPSCRHYVDSDNYEYTRREAKVIKASDSCTKLRRTKGNDIAIILPEESSSCAAVEVGCHEYKGNNGSNIRRVFLDDFESGLAGWSGDPSPTLSTEAAITGGHSMKVNNSVISRSVDLQVGKSYIISFWAKTNNNGDNPLQISLFNTANGSINFIDSDEEQYYSEWTYYQYGPATIPADFDLTNLKIGIDFDNTSYWIDNIILKEITEDIYIIEDSWFTPLSCSAEDNSQLGCQEYDDRAGNIHYLMSFSAICGEDKVGCTEFVDTHNSDSPFEQTWSVEYDENANTTSITVEADNLIYLVDDSQYYCAASNKGCTELGWQNQSTEQWYDVYLKSDPDNYDLSLCGFNGIGCDVYASEGKEVYLRDPGDNTCVYLENYERNGSIVTAGWYQTSSLEEDNLVACAGGLSLPKRRDDNWTGAVGLCQIEYDGCTEFIDPYATQGDNLLYNGEFEINTNSNTAPDFWGNATTTGYIDWSASMGRDNSGGVRAKYILDQHGQNLAMKQNVDVQAGLDYVITYDVSNNGADFYVLKLDCSTPIESYDNSLTNFASYGTAPADRYTASTMTTELETNHFVTYSSKFRVESDGDCDIILGYDPQSDEAYLDNVKVQELKSYYYINDDNINGTDCNGQVSWDKGCILTLDTANVSYDTGEIIRSYNSSATYRNSDINNGYLVATIGCEADDQNCDANRIIRVTKDRECAEWIQCQSSSLATQLDGTVKEYCYDLGRCTELSPDGSICVSWLEKDAQVISDMVYQNRETGWSGKEYSGYSLFNRYNIEDLLAKTKSQGNSNILVLSREDNDSLGINGIGLTIEPTCRLFPDAEAPYATTGLNVVFDDDGNIVERPLEMTQANFCYQGEDCECDYQKVTYSGGEVRYYDLKYSGVPQTLSYSGYDLEDPNDDYSSYLTGINKYKGFWGFCLEPDYSRRVSGYVDPNYQTNSAASYPCITWMPLDILSGEYNPAAVNIEDDLGIDFDNMYYCVAGQAAIYEELLYSSEEIFNEDFSTGAGSFIPYSFPNEGNSNDVIPCSSVSGAVLNLQASVETSSGDDGWCLLGTQVSGVEPNQAYELSADITFLNPPGSGAEVAIGLYCNNSGSSTEYGYASIGNSSTQHINILYNNNYASQCTVTLYLRNLNINETLSVNFDNIVLATYLPQGANEFKETYICEEFAKIGSLKFNDFIYGPEDFSIPFEQYNNAYGASTIEQNISWSESSAINVEPLTESVVVSNAGTPYVNTGLTYSDSYYMDICTFNPGNFNTGSGECIGSDPGYCVPYGSNPIPFSGPSCAGSSDCSSDEYCHNLGDPGTCNVDESIQCYYNDDCVGAMIPDPYYDCNNSMQRELCYQEGGHCYGLDLATPQAVIEDITNPMGTGLTKAFSMLKKIVAKIVNIFSWSGTSYINDSLLCLDDDNNSSCDITSSGEPVNIKQVVWDNQLEDNNEGGDGITVNDYQLGDIEYSGNIYNTTLKFYAYNEDGNQLPLKHLVIDWDDSTSWFGVDSDNVPEPVALKNHQHLCESSCADSLLDVNDFFVESGWLGKRSFDLENDTEHNLGARFSEGEVITLEFSYNIGGNIGTDSLPVYWCYDVANCGQDSGGYQNQGQTQTYPTLNFDDMPSSGSGVYRSSIIVTSEMVNGCYNLNNPSGYCLKELGLGHILSSGGFVTIDSVGLYYGCRANNECQYTKFDGQSLGQCIPTDVGDDLNYCVDDVGGGIGYFSFNHTYICSDPVDTNVPLGVDNRMDACVYQPRVYVEDSWGWCSNGYGPFECAIEEDGSSWVEYQGSIILTP